MSDSCPCDLNYDPNVHVPRSELEEMRAQRLVWQDKLLAALELGVAPHLSVGLTVVERTTAELREELAQVRAQLESIDGRLNAETLRPLVDSNTERITELESCSDISPLDFFHLALNG